MKFNRGGYSIKLEFDMGLNYFLDKLVIFN